MFDFLENKALIVVFILFVALAIFSKWVFDKNIELRSELQKEKELYIKTVEAYEKNKKLDIKLQELKQETQIKKDEATVSHTKLKVEIAKRGEIKEGAKNENSNNDDDFSIVSF